METCINIDFRPEVLRAYRLRPAWQLMWELKKGR